MRRSPCFHLLCICLSLFSVSSANALSITFDNAFTITDNMPFWDLDGTVGTIKFDSTLTAPLTTSGYDLKGEVTILASGTTLAMANATSILTLTNFVADTGSNLPGQNVVLDFNHTFTVTGPVNAVSAIDPYVANGNGQAIFANGASSNAVGFGVDTVNDWYGYVSGQTVFTPTSGGPLPLLSPSLPAGGGTLPYNVYTHGPQPMGNFAPVVGAHLDFTLGAPRDQLILTSSAQVGYYAVPEASSLLMLGAAGLFILPAVLRRKKFSA
ncbi:hypothetical protein K2Y11_07610 [bacterium]|nr:hypothetical protein [bacterium]